MNGTVRQHLEKNSGKFPVQVLKKLGEDLYVDDITSGCVSVEEGKEFFEVSVGVMKEAGLDLRKWMTNDKRLQRFFDRGKESNETKKDEVTFAKSVNGTVNNGHHKVLGLEWDRESDELLFDFKDFIKKSEDGLVTKRKILSLSASIYDPLGMIIKGKEKTWKVWVENRVVKIRKVVPRENWFHVTGVENPADTPTRAVEDFVSLFQGIWFSGPPFLLKNEIDFPELCNVRI